MKQQRAQPYIWVTWLSKVMAGDQACIWSSWFKTHWQGFNKVAGDFDLARWNIDHTKLLTLTRAKLHAQGAEVRVEGQNSFRFHHASGAIVAGKPDLVSLYDTSAVVGDCKTGRPKTADQVQVMIYMHLLPLCFPEYSLCSIEGRVIYSDHEIEIPAAAVGGDFGEQLDYFVNLLASAEPPARAPSQCECRFCDITSRDCAERVASEKASA